jgi:hypothetical protein
MQVEWTRFKPFGPQEEMYAVRLRGFDRYKQPRQFKAALRTFEAMVRGRGLVSPGTAGGWLDTFHRWFIKDPLWPYLCDFFEAIGTLVVEVPMTEDQLRLEGQRYIYKSNLKYAGEGDPVFSENQYNQRMANR